MNATYGHDRRTLADECRIEFTPYACKRMRERMIMAQLVRLVTLHWDQSEPSHSGRTKLRVSRRKAMELRQKGIGPRATHLIENLVVVADDDVVITTYRARL